MKFNAFDLIADKLEEALKEKNFVRDGEVLTEDNGEGVVYRSEELLYCVFYNENAKMFELRSAEAEEEKPEWKSISKWLFDPESTPLSEAEGIADDFLDTLSGPKKTTAVQPARKKKKGEEAANDPVLFFNRLVNVFPELRDEMNRERIEYGVIRPFLFAKEKVAPKVQGVAERYASSDVCKKMCEVFSDMYKAGDLDTRSVITNVIINSLTPEQAEKVIPLFDDDLKKAAAAERKLIGKKIKPEKKKKPRKITAASLNDIKKY